MSNIWIGFSRDEFKCKCGCGFDVVDAELLEALKEAKSFFGNSTVIINCGCRCKRHNKDVGGAPKSKHLLGKAADIRVIGFHPDSVAEYFESTYPGKYGIGRYNSFTHIDVRKTPARWDRRG